MPRPPFETDEDMAELRKRFEEADRKAMGLLAEQIFLSEASKEELAKVLTDEELKYVLACRQEEGLEAEGPEEGELASLLGKVFDLIQRIVGPVNGIAQPLVGRAFAGGPTLPEIRMRHVGYPDEELVIFRFSRPIREAVLMRGNALIFRSSDLPADAALEIWSEDVVRNSAESPLDWEFVEDLEWRINWSV